MEVGMNDSYKIGTFIIPMPEFLTRENFENYRSQYDRGDVNECWLWDGTLNSDGYAVFVAKGADGHTRQLLGHRFGFSYIYGPVKTNTLVMHTCNNPRCVNPFHLETGTCFRNSQHMVKCNRIVRPRAKLQDDVVEVLEKASAGVMSLTQLAEVFHVGRGEISNIVNGRVFKEITVPFIQNRELPL